MLIPKTKREIFLNRIRIWLPVLFVVIALVFTRPAWNLWGIPLILLGEGLRIWAAGHLVKDEQLTIGGPYRYVRNPLYLGSLLSGLGFLVILGNFGLAVAFIVISLAIYLLTVRQEENYLLRMHREAFEQYRSAVPAILPRVTPYRLNSAGMDLSRAESREIPALQLRDTPFEWRWVWLNKEHKTWIALALLFVLLGVRTWWGK